MNLLGIVVMIKDFPGERMVHATTLADIQGKVAPHRLQVILSSLRLVHGATVVNDLQVRVRLATNILVAQLVTLHLNSDALRHHVSRRRNSGMTSNLHNTRVLVSTLALQSRVDQGEARSSRHNLTQSGASLTHEILFPLPSHENPELAVEFHEMNAYMSAIRIIIKDTKNQRCFITTANMFGEGNRLPGGCVRLLLVFGHGSQERIRAVSLHSAFM